ncbi:P1 family peptidase [Streptomyces sp. NPDC014623]|uniref:P1 family peptidase n=1 Tax=Streptomyces sp. NPDC014623 TaxID=3364875 RepID=UPI0036F99C51
MGEAGGGGGTRTSGVSHATPAVVAALPRAQAQKLAGTAHDGLARAARPVHLLTGEDTVFAFSSGDLPLPPQPFAVLDAIPAAGADAAARALVKAVRATRGTGGPGGAFPSYSEFHGAPRRVREPLARRFEQAGNFPRTRYVFREPRSRCQTQGLRYARIG